MGRKKDPSEVFFPNKVVEPKYFVDREEVGKLERSMIENKVPLIYGNTATGKSSLVKYYVSDKKNIYITVVPDLNIENIRTECYQQVKGKFEDIEKQDNITVKGNFLGLGGEKGSQTRKVALKNNPTNDIAQLCENNMLILDNLEAANSELRLNITGLILLFVNDADKKLILAGTDSDDFYQDVNDPIKRRLKLIRVDPLPVDLAQQIVSKGMDELGLENSQKLCRRIARIALGNSSQIHYISMQVAYNARRAGTYYIANSYFNSAIKEMLNDDYDSLQREYPDWAEIPSNTSRYILFILAFQDEPMYASDLKLNIESFFAQTLSDEDLNSYLKRFMQEKRVRKEFNGYKLTSERYELYVRAVISLKEKDIYDKLSKIYDDIEDTKR